MADDFEIKLDHSTYTTGWVDDPVAVQEVVGSLEYTHIDETPIGALRDEDLPKEVYFNKFAHQVAGSPTLRVMNQGNLGSCVGFGTARAVEASYIVEIANGDAEEFKYLSREVIYAGSRVEVNGGRSPFRGDGSVGAWAAKWCTTWGIVAMSKYGEIDLSEYSTSRGKTWGSQGVPKEIEEIAKQHPIKNTTMVLNVEEAKKALANGYGISVCSSQGFTSTRDRNGVCRPQGVWQHCMACIGYTHISDKLYFLIDNSWGNYLSGPNPTYGNGGSFLCDGGVFASMLSKKDSFAFAGVEGFKVKDHLDWSF